MKNKDIFELFNALQTLKDLQGVKFNYAVARNIAKLNPEIESLKKSLEATPEFNKFDAERAEMAKKYAKKDEKGEAILKTVNKQEQFEIEDMDAFTKEFETLKETHKEVIESRTKQLKDFEELLETQNPVELHKIKLSDIPENINTEQLKGIYILIEE